MKKRFINLAAIFFLMAALLSACSLLDRTPPTIESKSPSIGYGEPLDISDVADVSDDYPGVEAIFQESDSWNGEIAEDGKSITFSKPGEYSVVIVATDARGNNTEAECTVSVIDVIAPQILSVSGGESIGYGERLTLANSSNAANALVIEYDDVSDVSLSIDSVVNGGDEVSDGGFELENDHSVVFSQVGNYVLTISATDVYGNSSAAQTNVSVVDLTRPALSGLERIVLSERDVLPSFVDGVVAIDEVDGDLTQNINIDFSSVEKGVPGTYKVIYSVEDAAGNAVREERIVLIEDTTPPTLTVSKNSINLTVGDKKPDYASLVSAQDTVDGDVSGKVVIDDSGVDYSTPGTYEVKYSVSDGAGNTNDKTLKITVKAKVASTSGDSGGVTVYITKTGSKYHASGCRYLSKSKIAISKSSAQARGYTACSVCHPG